MNESWGGSFEVRYEKYWEDAVRRWKKQGGEVIHLTMYGLPIQEVIGEIRKSPKDKLILVGGAKVPRVTYEMADWNVSITSQPHSEISALAVFLHELYEREELKRTFEKAKVKIIPQAKGKKVEKTKI